MLYFRERSPVEGELVVLDTARRYRVQGHLSVGQDGRTYVSGEIERHELPEKETLPEEDITPRMVSAEFAGTLKDGTKVKLERIWILTPDLHIDVGQGLFDFSASQAVFVELDKTTTATDVEVRVEWMLFHSNIVVSVGKLERIYDLEMLQDLGVDPDTMQKRFAAQPDSLSWEWEGKSISFRVKHAEIAEIETQEPTYTFVAERKYRRPYAFCRWSTTLVQVDDDMRRVEKRVETLLRCISYLEGYPISWEQKTVEIRVADKAVRRTIHRRALIVPSRSVSNMNKASAFTRSSPEPARILKVMADHYDENPELVEAVIESVLLGKEADVGTTRFLLFATAVESLKALYLCIHGEELTCDGEHLLPSNQFRKLAKDIRRVIRDHQAVQQKSERVSEMLSKKVPELNRPSYQSVLAAACQQWSVKVDDLWPRQGDQEQHFGFVPIRDKLIHTGQIDDWTLFFQELWKIERFVTRLFAGVFGLPNLPEWQRYL
ncbi:MAG TPA: hypothetical protein VKK81_03195 [Candidatus Binatia bacterium]|nr:hypothetical protein [Candidatus Binatia bacterium]